MIRRRLLPAVLYGLAMGYLEAAVVVYLRRLYYPAGFEFPLVAPPVGVALVELGRELATLVMLWAVAALAGRSGRERFAWFAFLFGVWDLVYYVTLRLVLGWPASLLTWDVLFMVPLLWTGPVLAPLLVSVSLVVTALLMLRQEARRVRVELVAIDRVVLGVALALCLYAFMANHGAVFAGRLPGPFPWPAFGLALLLAVGVVLKALRWNPRSRLPE